MNYFLLIVLNPFFWIFFCGLFFGASLNKLTQDPSKRSNSKKAKKEKWILFFIYLSLSVLLFLFGLIFPGFKKVFTFKILYFFIIITMISFLFYKFKRSFGIPLMISSILFVITLLLFVRSLISFTGEMNISDVKVVTFEDRVLEMEVKRKNKDVEKVKLWGDAFAPIVQIIVFDDIYVFMGSKTKYRFLGFTSFLIEKENGKIRYKQSDTDHYFDDPQGISGTVYEWFERNESLIPGIKTTQVEIDLKRPKNNSTYSILLQNDGGIQIIEN